MDQLIAFHTNNLARVPGGFFRELFQSINWNQRMLAIKGPRGAGKTTLMLQRIKFGLQSKPPEALYITADHHWFYSRTLYETAEVFYVNGGKYLFIDEVHKYPNWSRELKNIYDGFPELSIVFSASSALDIYKGEADLSRRVLTYELPGLSFREYIELKENVRMDSVSLDAIQKDHEKLAAQIVSDLKMKPIPLFREYLQYGYLPIIAESLPEEIPLRLNAVINAVVESDLSYIKNYHSGTAHKIKKLLGVIAESTPFKPNVSALARKLDVSRESVYQWLQDLDHARLLNSLSQAGKGTSTLQKPDKIYLENTNLSYALNPQPDTGSIREAFLLNQLINAGYEVTLPKAGDFYVDGITIEAGGKSKTSEQVQHTKNYIIAADNIEFGFGKKVPLWLFGFLY